MSDDRDPNAPDIRNLRALRPFVRDAARAVVEKRLSGKGTKVAHPALPLRPLNMCSVCGKGFNMTRTADDIKLKHEDPCPDCESNLDQGYTAFICDNRFVFAKSAHLADMAGKVIKVEAHVMDAMESRFKIEQRFKPKDGADPQQQ